MKEEFETGWNEQPDFRDPFDQWEYMKNLLFTSSENPPVLEVNNDIELCQRISNEYGIQFDKLCDIVYRLRRWEYQKKELQSSIPKYISLKFLADVFDNPEVKIEDIILKTDKGDRTIHTTNKIHDLMVTLLRNGLAQAAREEKWRYHFEHGKEYGYPEPGFVQILVFGLNEITQYKKRVITGMLCSHFGFYKNNPLLSESEWLQNGTEANSWKKYLSDIVKSWEKISREK